jgi:hypothetical protein
MAVSIDQFAREIKTFRDRKVVLKAMRVAIRKPFPSVRAAIKANALTTLPKRGGLNAWVAAIKVTLSIKSSSPRSAGVVVKGGRNSTGARSDIRAIDSGRVRAPSWGRRGPGQWHTVTVQPGFFTTPVVEAKGWHEEIDKAVDDAFNTIRRG